MTTKPHFSCVFLRSRDHVLLVQKSHPDWQAGRWNGVGGKQEDGETAEQCAIREFQEETGILLDQVQEFMVLEDSDVIVHFFRSTVGDFANLSAAIPDLNDRGERLLFHGFDEFFDTDEYIDNLGWLIPMAFQDKFHVTGSVSALRRDENGNPV